MVEQISIFAENKKGSMREITQLLTDNSLNIYCAITNDSAEYGIVRLLVDETDRAIKLLKDNGFTCKLSRVIGVKIPDNVGSLNKLLADIEDSNINLDYLYVSYSREDATPVAILHASGYAEVAECLRNRGYSLI
ncbi:MAG TPA: amino acid-binding protein [Lachnospiraceae bacterium]|nr:amino acid-binding protein [Lachnospiraceae bacterium]